MIRPVKEAARPWILAAAAVVTVIGVILAIATVVTSRRPAPPPRPVAAKPPLPAPPVRPLLMFISLIPDAGFKHVVMAPLDAPDGPHYVTPLQCDRVYYAG